MEQALAKAQFLTSSELVVLQAFILFLVLVRRHDDTRFCWTLTGLAIRIGQSMGLHRDGTSFPGLTPLEIEMRRRLFWALCILDLRSAEDQGTDLTIVDRAFDTEFPLNINDADISEDTTELPPARHGITEMTFSLSRYETCSLARRLHTMSSAAAASCPRDAASSLQERENMVRQTYQRVERKYFQNSDPSRDPVLWTAANIARVIIAKMTLVLYQPMLFPGPNGEMLSSEIRDRLFTAATEVFEYNHQLNSDPRSKQWRWLFQTYTQWHAVAYVLMEVVRRPWSAAVERAWAALNAIFASPDPEDLNRIAGDQSVWLPLKKIYLKARKHREAEIARLKANPAAAQQLEIEDRDKAGGPLSLGEMPGSVRSALASERWRKLVNAPPLPQEVESQRAQSFAQPQPQQQQLQQQPLPPQQQQQQQSGQNGDIDVSRQFPGNMDISELPGSDTNEARAIDMVGNSMAQPQFQPENFWAMAFAPQYDDVTRATTTGGGFPFMPGEPMPKQGGQLGNFADGDGASGVSGVPSMSGDPRMQPTPLVDALKVQGNIPPWLWNDPSAAAAAAAFGNSPTNTPVATGSSGGGGGGRPLGASAVSRPFSFPLTPGNDGLHPEDIDVNMDDDFNWADWGQSLIETSGAGMGSVWSSHGM